MNHKENYAKLFNTLVDIETKGENTMIMAGCLQFLSQCIRGCKQAEVEAELKAETETPEEGEAS